MWHRSGRSPAAVQRADVSRRPSHRGTQEVRTRRRLRRLGPGERCSMTDGDCYHEQLQRDAHFLCSDPRMDTDLVDRLVLQMNRIYPQILSDKEAHKFRKLSVPTKARFADLLKHLHVKGDEACLEFYRGLHIHAEDVYFSLPTRAKHNDVADPERSDNVDVHSERYVLNNRGPMFFLSCFSFVVGAAILYYYGDGETSSPFLHCSAVRLGE